MDPLFFCHTQKYNYLEYEEKKKINLELLTTRGHVEGSQRGSVLTGHKHKKATIY